MIPPGSPSHPRIDRATLTQQRQLEEQEDKVFVKQLISQKPLQVKVSLKRRPDLARLFCCWECVKRYAMEDCPRQLRYERQMLIDLAAGYIVDIS